MTAHLAITGNATADAELRFTANGAAVASVTLAVTPRVKQDGQWTDGPAAFYRCTAWQTMAEHMAESVRKGDRVTVVGELQPREYTDNHGNTRLSLDVRADSVALDLRFRAARTIQATRTSSPSPHEDPWTTEPSIPPPSQPNQAAGYPEEPPF